MLKNRRTTRSVLTPLAIVSLPERPSRKFNSAAFDRHRNGTVRREPEKSCFDDVGPTVDAGSAISAIRLIPGDGLPWRALASAAN